MWLQRRERISKFKKPMCQVLFFKKWIGHGSCLQLSACHTLLSLFQGCKTCCHILNPVWIFLLSRNDEKLPFLEKLQVVCVRYTVIFRWRACCIRNHISWLFCIFTKTHTYIQKKKFPFFLPFFSLLIVLLKILNAVGLLNFMFHLLKLEGTVGVILSSLLPTQELSL